LAEVGSLPASASSLILYSLAQKGDPMLPIHPYPSVDDADDRERRPGDQSPGMKTSADGTPCAPEDLAGVPTMYMTAGAYRDVLDYLTSPEHGDCEAGGMLIGPRDHPFLVTQFIPDPDAETSVATYRPSAEWLNKILKKFVACGSDCKGLAHKHPDGCTQPSYGDLVHVHSTFGRAKNSDAMIFFMPIVCAGRLYPWLITRDEPDRVHLAKLVIV
jgi:hypothetical protein